MHTRCVHARGAHGHALIDGWRASRGAAAKLNGMELMGRNLKISHPNGYVPPQGTPDTYDLPEVRPLGCPWNRSRPKPPEAARSRPTPPDAARRRPKPPNAAWPPVWFTTSLRSLSAQDLMKRFGLGSYEAMRRQDRPPAELADRKARELYVGNLTIGCVTSQVRKLALAAATACGGSLRPVARCARWLAAPPLGLTCAVCVVARRGTKMADAGRPLHGPLASTPPRKRRVARHRGEGRPVGYTD